MINARENMTPRESQQFAWDKEMFEKQAEHAIRIKELEIEATKLESKIVAWFKLPLYVLRLPVSVFLVLVLGIYAIRGIEPPKELVELIK